MEIVTKAKKSAVAYEKSGPRKPGRERPPKKGAAVHLKEAFLSHKEKFQEAEIELYGKKERIHPLSVPGSAVGAEAVSGTALCPGRNERNPEYSCEYQPGTGTRTAFHHPPVQLPFSDRMHLPGAETADRGILLSFLVKAYA